MVAAHYNKSKFNEQQVVEETKLSHSTVKLVSQELSQVGLYVPFTKRDVQETAIGLSYKQTNQVDTMQADEIVYSRMAAANGRLDPI